MTLKELLILLTIVGVVVGLLYAASVPDTDTKDFVQSKDFGRVYDFTLDDGTRCVYVTRAYQGGLSCDWVSKHE